MKVYELMTELAKAPCGAEVKFHTLSRKDESNVTNYLDDPECYVVDLPNIYVEYIDEDNVQITAQ
jgi:hypothetical protein